MASLAYQTSDFAYQGFGLFAYQDEIGEVIQKFGGDDRPLAQRHRGFNLKEWKRSRKLDDDIERTLRQVWARITGDAPDPVFQEAAEVVLRAAPKGDKIRDEVDWQAFATEWTNVYRLMEIYDEWQRDEEDVEFLLLNG